MSIISFILYEVKFFLDFIDKIVYNYNMDELLQAFGFKLEFHETYIRLIRPLIFIEQNQQVGISGMAGQILTYQGGQLQWGATPPNIIWFYQTEFGEQLEKYNAKMNPSYTFQPQPQSGFYRPGAAQLGIGPYQGISSGAAIQQQQNQYGLLQQQGQLGQLQLQGQQLYQQSLQGQLQQASLQQQSPYTIQSSGQMSLLGQSPQHSVTIKNLAPLVHYDEEPEKKFTLLNKIKKWFVE